MTTLTPVRHRRRRTFRRMAPSPLIVALLAVIGLLVLALATILTLAAVP
jgi:uncharacterized membrane protein YdfJ with MMPL/SSD domain